jgi:hypothetical protein
MAELSLRKTTLVVEVVFGQAIHQIQIHKNSRVAGEGIHTALMV